MRWLGWATFALVVVTLGGVFAMSPRDDVPERPDAIVILGGSAVERTALGLELRDRHGGLLVLPPSIVPHAASLGVHCGGDVICTTPDPDTTAGEARVVAELAAEHGWDELAVATTRFHSTRARVLFRQCLGDRVNVVGAPRPDGSTVGPLKYLREIAGIVVGTTVRRPC